MLHSIRMNAHIVFLCAAVVFVGLSLFVWPGPGEKLREATQPKNMDMRVVENAPWEYAVEIYIDGWHFYHPKGHFDSIEEAKEFMNRINEIEQRNNEYPKEVK